MDGPPQAKKNRIDENDCGKEHTYFAFQQKVLINRAFFRSKNAFQTIRKCGNRKNNSLENNPHVQYCIMPDYDSGNFFIDLKIKLAEAIFIMAEYKIESPTLKFSKNVSRFFEKTMTVMDYCFNRVSVNDSLPLSCKNVEIIVTGKITIIPAHKGIHFALKSFFPNSPGKDEIILPPKYDFTLFVNGHKLGVHKKLIQPALPMIEFNTSKNFFEISTHFPLEIVKAAIAFAYGSPIPDLQIKDLNLLIEFAKAYGSETLIKKAGSLYVYKINEANCVEIANTIYKLNIPELKRQTMQYLFKAKHEKNININFQALDTSIFNDLFFS